MPYTPLYIAGALAALIALSTAAFLMLRTETPGDTGTFSSSGGLFSWSDPAPAETPSETPYQGDASRDLGVVPLPPDPAPSENDSSDTFVSDLAKLLAQLTQPPAQTFGAKDFTPSSYSYIPQGLVSFNTQAQPRTAEAQALFEYGNTIGGTLQAFGDLHPDMPQILKDQAEDRSNAVKNATLKRLADDFTKLGDNLSTTASVPSAAANTHTALVAAYRDVGDKLKKIPDAQGDEAFLAAINTYNGSAENLSRRLVELVDLFASTNTQFSSSDAGSIFMFSGSASF